MGNELSCKCGAENYDKESESIDTETVFNDKVNYPIPISAMNSYRE